MENGDFFLSVDYCLIMYPNSTIYFFFSIHIEYDDIISLLSRPSDESIHTIKKIFENNKLYFD